MRQDGQRGGSPVRSRFDSRDIWKRYDYRTLGITGEPYFDIDFNSVRYLTDTGRMWDGERYSVRDKGDGKYEGRRTKDEQRESRQWDRYHSTFDIIRAVKEGTFPGRVMMTFHPQRWTDNPFDWTIPHPPSPSPTREGERGCCRVLCLTNLLPLPKAENFKPQKSLINIRYSLPA